MGADSFWPITFDGDELQHSLKNENEALFTLFQTSPITFKSVRKIASFEPRNTADGKMINIAVCRIFSKMTVGCCYPSPTLPEAVFWGENSKIFCNCDRGCRRGSTLKKIDS